MCREIKIRMCNLVNKNNNTIKIKFSRSHSDRTPPTPYAVDNEKFIQGNTEADSLASCLTKADNYEYNVFLEGD